MKKSILKISALALFGLLTYTNVSQAFAYTCRTEKLECKEAMKQDGDYTSGERAECRAVKLACLEGPAQ